MEQKAINLKIEARLKMKARLAALSAQEYQEYNRSVHFRFLKLGVVRNAGTIMLYFSVRNEVETAVIISDLLELGKTVALPICTPERDLKVGIIKDIKQLQPARYGLMEPGPETALIDLKELELVVVPGLAFDEKGYRLGQGHGYYDRFLSRLPCIYKLGLAYDFQVVPELFIEVHDIKLNGVLTPTRYLEFGV